MDLVENVSQVISVIDIGWTKYGVEVGCEIEESLTWCVGIHFRENKVLVMNVWFYATLWRICWGCGWIHHRDQ